MSSTSEHPAVPGDQTTAARGFGWRKLLSFSAISAGLVIGYSAIVVFKSSDPPFMVMLGFFILGGLAALRRGKRGVVGAVMATLAAVMFTAFAGPGIALAASPVSPRDFIAATVTLTLTLTVIVSAIASAMGGRGRGFAPSRARP